MKIGWYKAVIYSAKFGPSRNNNLMFTLGLQLDENPDDEAVNGLCAGLWVPTNGTYLDMPTQNSFVKLLEDKELIDYESVESTPNAYFSPDASVAAKSRYFTERGVETAERLIGAKIFALLIGADPPRGAYHNQRRGLRILSPDGRDETILTGLRFHKVCARPVVKEEAKEVSEKTAEIEKIAKKIKKASKAKIKRITKKIRKKPNYRA